MEHQLLHGQLSSHIQGFVCKMHTDLESLLGLPGETSASSGKKHNFFPYLGLFTEKNQLEETVESEYPQQLPLSP